MMSAHGIDKTTCWTRPTILFWNGIVDNLMNSSMNYRGLQRITFAWLEV